jgi:hypothetical protein
LYGLSYKVDPDLPHYGNHQLISIHFLNKSTVFWTRTFMTQYRPKMYLSINVLGIANKNCLSGNKLVVIQINYSLSQINSLFSQIKLTSR